MNFLLISLICAVAAFVIGMIWYAPFVFGKAWAKLTGVDLNKKDGCAMKMLTSFLANFALAVTLYSVALWSDAYGVDTGMVMGLLLSLGVVMMAMMSSYVWEGRSPKLFMIDAGHQVVVVITMSMIITSLI